MFHEDYFPFAQSIDSPPFCSHPIPFMDCSEHEISESILVSSVDPPTVPAPSGDSMVQPRRSTRTTRPPVWTTDYSCPSLTRTNSAYCVYPISRHLQYSNFSPYQSFVAAISSVTEPQFYHEAVTDPRWRQAMNLELAALESNHTWAVVDLPENTKPIGCRWVYKIKYLPDGNVDRFKARLVAKGYTQLPGMYFHDTFSPTAKIVTIRCLLALTAINRRSLNQWMWPLPFSKEIWMRRFSCVCHRGVRFIGLIKFVIAQALVWPKASISPMESQIC